MANPPDLGYLLQDAQPLNQRTSRNDARAGNTFAGGSELLAEESRHSLEYHLGAFSRPVL